MTDFRATLSTTLNGSLQPAEHEANVDRLGAFAVSTTRLGSLLLRLKYDADSTCHRPAIIELATLAGSTIELAELAISEWYDQKCRRCRGAQLTINKKHVTCPKCNGTALHRVSDRERAAYLRCSIGKAKQYDKALKNLHKTISEHEGPVNGRMNRELER